jgi:hypothetical protein
MARPHRGYTSTTAIGLALLVASCASTATCCRKAGTGSEDRQIRVIERATRPGLARFASDAELDRFLKEVAKAQAEDERARASKEDNQPPPTAAGAAPAEPPPGQAESAQAESVTNVQHAGVDEGGIVKVHGDHLVVLRRGRLFTVRVGDDALTPVSAVDAFGPDIEPSETWYDEMLVSGDTIVVVGYSYQRGGTELGLFDLDARGAIRYRATYHLRSDDYYSSRNFASRLIGKKLVFYTPLYLAVGEKQLRRSFPALRKWHKGVTDDEWRQLAPATRVYRPILPSAQLTLHTVTTCDLAGREPECSATAVMGPAGRVFYVSPSSVYVWVTEWPSTARERKPQSVVYRLPLTEGDPQALRVSSAPVDQFSFLEAEDRSLNVLVRADAVGDGMWGAEIAAGDVALLRVPLDAFGDGSGKALASHYKSLPKPAGYTFQNRFVGPYILYGTGGGWGSPTQATSGELYAYPYAGGQASRLPLSHGVDRIEALGTDAIAIGSGGKDLCFTPISLATRPNAASPYVRKDATQGELRSHGFFYKPDGTRGGMLGLPVRGAGKPGYSHLVQDSASILFLRNDDLRLRELGNLESGAPAAGDDKCRASCVDWYGNARPLFLKGKVFALLGYEIVEGRVTAEGISERRRINFAPGSLAVAR